MTAPVGCRLRTAASDSGRAFPSGFVPFFRWPGVREDRQGWSFLGVVLCRAGLHDQQRHFFAASVVDQVQGFFDRTDHERMFVHAHGRSRLLQAVKKVFGQFDGNLVVNHKSGA